MDMLWIVLGVVAALVVGYLVFNGKRNSDPLNRKCAAEICEYLTSATDAGVPGIHEIFMRNARYQAQANHVVSMVPVLLMNAGVPRERAMSIVSMLRSAAS
jgi:hypothetical protein